MIKLSMGVRFRFKQASDLDTSCIILAGGKSIRLGHDKVLEKLGNSSLLEQVISRINFLSKEIIIVTAKERTFPQLGRRPKIRFVSDIFPGKGSLGGIYTGLVASGTHYNIIVAADMPFLNEALLRYMLEVSDGFDFILPRIDTFFEPLHAVYSKYCIGPIESMIKQGRKVIIELFDYVRVRYIEAEEIDKFDPQHLSFFNVNTKEDLELAKKIAGGVAD
jgi:molybdopterin-guanine dinucleotide biosynthesis protein A